MKVILHNPNLRDELGALVIDRLPCLIGRASGCDQCLPYIFVSRYHCRLSRRGKELILEDLKSFNGTFVNGTRIHLPTRLRHGDEVGLGPFAFRVHTFDLTRGCEGDDAPETRRCGS
jgi:pSer/pThr/pTyr-binding forkhead associated (FHA) protein